jgi:hypothetical protein
MGENKHAKFQIPIEKSSDEVVGILYGTSPRLRQACKNFKTKDLRGEKTPARTQIFSNVAYPLHFCPAKRLGKKFLPLNTPASRISQGVYN